MRIHRWFFHLCVVHENFCTNLARCPGLRTLPELLDQNPEAYIILPATAPGTCAHAAAAEALITQTYFGYRLLPFGTEPNDVPTVDIANYPTSPAFADAINKTYEEELASGKIEIVVQKPPWLWPLFCKDESTIDKIKIRTLTNLSATSSTASLNSFSGHQRFNMMGKEEIFALLQPFAVLNVQDVSAAYRTLGVFPPHWPLQSTRWERPDGTTAYVLNKRKIFGSSPSAEDWCHLSAAIRAICAAYGYPEIVVWVDDYLSVSHPCIPTAARDFLGWLIADLGGAEAVTKRQGPSTQVTYCGLLYNTNADGAGRMTVSIPAPKLAKAERLAREISAQSSVSLKQLTSALGTFRHLATAIYTAKVFLNRLNDALTAATAAGQTTIAVSPDMQADLRFWRSAVAKFNGEAIILRAPRQPAGYLYTDASDVGMAGFFVLDFAARSYLTFFVPWAIDPVVALYGLPPNVRHLVNTRLWPRRSRPTLWYIGCRKLWGYDWALLLWGGQHLSNVFTAPFQDNDLAAAAIRNLTSRHPGARLIAAEIAGHQILFNSRAEHSVT